VILDLDVGNSRVKYRLRSADSIHNGVFNLVDFEDLAEYLPDSQPERIRASYAADDQTQAKLTQCLKAIYGVEPEFALTQAIQGGLTCGYQDPSQLGVDRWLALLAAWTDAHRELVVVDLGTAITIDYTGADGQHLGGYIVPGQQVMWDSLMGNTVGIDVQGLEAAPHTPGRSTEEAIGHGVSMMISGFIERCIQSFTDNSEADASPSIYMCGGGLEHLNLKLSSEYNINPHLVLDGLHISLAS